MGVLYRVALRMQGSLGFQSRLEKDQQLLIFFRLGTL